MSLWEQKTINKNGVGITTAERKKRKYFYDDLLIYYKTAESNILGISHEDNINNHIEQAQKKNAVKTNSDPKTNSYDKLYNLYAVSLYIIINDLPKLSGIDEDFKEIFGIIDKLALDSKTHDKKKYKFDLFAYIYVNIQLSNIDKSKENNIMNYPIIYDD